ncbi:MAG: carboxypeptidase regulatory-like domain-containing protein [Bacteroidia bacterium]|nr:carboxypeptidase regulatory-like domain-containing protein [Bacteroidia bacterium]
MKRIIILLSVFLSSLFGCNKDEDIINTSITGFVLNIGTGNGFPNVEVQLIEVREKTFSTSSDIKVWYTTSDADGNFSFPDIPVNFNEKYSYSLYIKSWSTKDTEFFGSSTSFEKEDLADTYTIGVYATFHQLFLYLLENSVVIYPDTFIIVLEQRIKHFYYPTGLWQLEANSSHFTPIGHDHVYFSNHSMGWWHITFDKTKGGVHSVIYDSIYMDMGETKIYILPW